MFTAAGAAQAQQGGFKERVGAIKERLGGLTARSGSFFGEYMFGRIGGEALFGDPISHRFLAARLGLDYPFGGETGAGRIYIEGGYSHRSATLKQKRTNSNPEGSSDLPQTRELKASTSGVSLREAYLEYDPIENLSLAFGYQRPPSGDSSTSFRR